jgi:hypothetical protein
MKRFALILIVLAQFLFCQGLHASDSAFRLQLAVQRLNAWMGASENASRWRQTLLLNHLETQAAKGDRADLAQLKLVHERFTSGIPGLEHPAFVDVRKAIEKHMDLLTGAQNVAIEQYLANIETRFSPPTPTDIEASRQDSLYFLELFQSQYLPNDVDGMRDILFDELDLAATIERIKGVDVQSLLPNPNLTAEQEAERVASRRDAIRPLVEDNDRFKGKTVTIQDIYFNSAHTSLDRFVRILINATDIKLKEVVESQAKSLRDAYPRLGLPGERMASARIAAVLGALETTLQHGELIAAIRRKHSFPNAEVEVDSSLLEGLAGQPDSRIQPVSEIILGRQINGVAYTNSRAQIELLEDPNQIAASIHLLGMLHSDTYTRQGPITAFAGSNGQFDGRRNLFANIGGFYASDPYVALNLQSYFKNVDCRLPVVQKVAVKQYSRDKVQSEGIGAARAEARVHDEFRERTDEVLAEGRKKLSDQFGAINQYRSLIPNVFAYTRPDRVVAVAQKHDSIHLGANTMPVPKNIPSEVRVRVHESMVVNYVDPLIVGRNMTNGEIAEMIEQATGEKLEGLQESTDPEENWSITFAPVQPFQFELENNRAKIGIIGDRFTQSDRTIRTRLLISMVFKVIMYKGSYYLVRDGKIAVDALDKERLDARGVAFKTFLDKKLNQKNVPDKKPDPNLEPKEEIPGAVDRVQDEIVTAQVGGFPLPPNLIPVEQLRTPQIAEIARQLRLVEMRIDQGWLYSSWTRSQPGQALVVDLSAITPINSLDEIQPDKEPEKVTPPMPDNPTESKGE